MAVSTLEKPAQGVAPLVKFSTTVGDLMKVASLTALRGAGGDSIAFTVAALGVTFRSVSGSKSAQVDMVADVEQPCPLGSAWSVPRASINKALFGVSRKEGLVVSVVADKMRLEFASGVRNVVISPSDPIGDFWPLESGESRLVFDEALVQTISRHISKCMSLDAHCAVLCGVYVDTKAGALVATDTHRLAVSYARGKIQGKASPFIVPSWIVERMKNAPGATVYSRGPACRVVVIDGALTATYRDELGGTYPSWQRVVPEEATRRVQCDREGLVRAMRQIAGIAKDNAGRARLSFAPNLLTAADPSLLHGIVRARSEEVGDGEEWFPVSFCEGADQGFEIAFNFRYVKEAVQSLQGDEVILTMTESSRPVTIRSTTEEEAFVVVMPMALS